MNKEFYYLDEKKQKGFFSIDQLKTLLIGVDRRI